MASVTPQGPRFLSLRSLCPDYFPGIRADSLPKVVVWSSVPGESLLSRSCNLLPLSRHQPPTVLDSKSIQTGDKDTSIEDTKIKFKEDVEYTKIRYPNPESSDPNTELPIMKLSTDLLIHLFSYFDPVTATCFGLTCRRIYGSYRRLYAIPPNTDTNFWRRMRTFPAVRLNRTVIVRGKPLDLRYSELRRRAPELVSKVVPLDDKLYCTELVPLWKLLDNWMGPDLIWGGKIWNEIQIFLTKKTFQEEMALKKARARRRD